MKRLGSLLALGASLALVAGTSVASAATPVLISADPSLHLIGTRWTLATMDGTAVPTGVTITLNFAEGNRAFGNGGCNGYEAEYAAQDTALSFGPILSTMMACEDPAGTTEGTYLADLAKVTTWAVPADVPMGTQLTLSGPDGAPTLVYAPLPPSPDDLIGTSWQLFSVDGTEVSADVTTTLAFHEGHTVSGDGGCNVYGGDYIAVAGWIRFGPIMSTLALCPDPAGAQEATYFANLAKVTTWTVPTDAPFGSKLTLSGPSGTPTMDFIAAAPEGASLAGTSWTVTSIAGTAVDSTVTATMDFTSETEVSGNSGCNQYNGTYIADATTIAFGPQASTLMFCEGPAGDTEAAFHTALAASTAWAIGTDGSLTLSDDTGTAQMVLAPAGG